MNMVLILPDSPRNPWANAIVNIIYQVLGNLIQTYNLQETYVDDADWWMGILAEVAFAVRSTYHRTKVEIPDQLVFLLRHGTLQGSRIGLEVYASAQIGVNK